MRKLTMPALAFLLLAGGAAAGERQETERIDRTVQIRPGSELRLKNFSGRVTVTGSSRGDVAVHAVRRATRDRLDHIKLDIAETGAGVTIEANRRDDELRERDNNVVETEFDIEVPADVSVDIEAFSSDVVVKDVRGRQRVHTFSGNVDLAAGDKSVDAETFSGDITVKLTQGLSASIDFDSFSGAIRTDVPLTYRSSSRRHVRADVGGGGAGYSFKTFSGDVRIR